MECSRWRRARGLGLSDCWDGQTWNGSLDGGMIPFQIPDGDESHPSDGLEGTAKGVVWVVGGWRPRTCGLRRSRSWGWIWTDRPAGRHSPSCFGKVSIKRQLETYYDRVRSTQPTPTWLFSDNKGLCRSCDDVRPSVANKEGKKSQPPHVLHHLIILIGMLNCRLNLSWNFNQTFPFRLSNYAHYH